MKIILVSIVTMLTLLFSATLGIQFITTTRANPIVYQEPKITVLSPSQEVYNTSCVPLNVTIQLFGYTYSGNLENIQWLNYSIDTEAPTPIPVSYSSAYDTVGSSILSGSDTLSDLPNGLHNLVIQGKTDYNGTIYASVNFTINVPSQNPSLNPASSNTSLTQPSGFLGTNLPMTYGYAIVCTAVILTVLGVGLLIRFKKYKLQTQRLP